MPAENIKVSIIIPVYNVEEYLPKCLDSVINQTLRDIEIICIDDGSTDGSLGILENLANKDNRIKIITQDNNGVSSARNKGLEIAQGEYVMFVDSDDWLEYEACELAYKYISKFDADMLVFDLFNADKYGEKQITNWYRTFQNYEIFHFNNCPKKFFYTQTSIGAKLFKRTILYKYFDENIKKGEDTLFFWRICLENPKIIVLNKPLYNYLQNPDSAMFNTENIKNAEIFKALYKLKTYREYKNTTVFNKAHILDRFALSIEYEMRNNKDLITKDYIKKVQNLLKEIKIYDKKAKKNLKYYAKLKNTYYKIKYKKLTTSLRHIKAILEKNNIKNLENKVIYPIDIVYCWVDGKDKKWQNDKMEWQKRLNIPYTNAVNMCRFIDNEELKYSLRSVAKNAPWINHIYIVTNGQVPKWLDTSHPKITIVNHNEIMPKEALPVFSAYSIECCLANIPNLSEHFLYANDDFYIYSSVQPNYFFDNKGNPIVRFIQPKKKWFAERLQNELYIQNVMYSSDLIHKKFNKKYVLETTHNIDSYRKSYYLKCKELFQKEFDETIYSKFSRKNLVQRTIVNFYMVVSMNCKLLKERNASRKTPLENIIVKLESPEIMDKLITRHSPKLKLFCINDNETTIQKNRESLGLYLSHLFPQKQPWEK